MSNKSEPIALTPDADRAKAAEPKALEELRQFPEIRDRLNAIRYGELPPPIEITDDHKAVAQVFAVALNEWDTFEGGDAVAAITPTGPLAWDDMGMAEWLGIFFAAALSEARAPYDRLTADLRKLAEELEGEARACFEEAKRFVDDGLYRDLRGRALAKSQAADRLRAVVAATEEAKA